MELKSLVLILFYLLTYSAFSKDKLTEVDTFLVRKEDELALLLKTLRDSKNDGELEMNNITFTSALEEILEYPGTLTYPFEKLNTMSTLQSPDGEFRLFNWNVESQDLVHSHYCFLVRKYRNNKNQVIKFKEDKFTLPPRPDGMLNPNRWYGALYYKIIPVQSGNKTLYTMIGFNGGTRSSNKKILDVFWFKGKSLRIGYPLFQDEREPKVLNQRVFFEYSDKATASVHYEANINKIVFDHLIPETGNLKGIYEYYIPDMSYDAYYWEDDIWKFQVDIAVGNDREKKRREYYIDPETGEEKYRIVPVNWVDPTDPGSGNGKHEVADIENNDYTEKEKKKLKREADKQDRKVMRKKRKAYKHQQKEAKRKYNSNPRSAIRPN